MKKSTNIIFMLFVSAFLVSIFSVSVANYAVSDNEYSDTENRSLASFPTLNLQNIFDGSFMQDFETYMSDQFVLRDKIVQLKAKIDLILGSKELNDVLIGDDGYLFELQSDFDLESVTTLTATLTDFSSNYESLQQSIVISPNSSYTQVDLLPTGYEFDSQLDQLETIQSLLSESNLTWLDVLDSFDTLDDDTQLFYKTDHHWTTAAAFSVFETLADTWGLEYDEDYYEFYTVSTDFQGTLSTKSGIDNSYDTIQICVPSDSSGTYIVDFISDDMLTNSLFFLDELDTINQYEVFLGGNYEKIEITTTSASTDILLIVKDSYANCMIPMLTPYFEQIIIIDPRYYTKELSLVLQDYDFTHVLYLYNLNTLLQDTSLIEVLA